MSYPDKPICHGDFNNTPFRIKPIEWEVREAEGNYGFGAKHCNYCGSLHPEDLLKALETPGVSVEVADWKYGWPHKLYINGIPNPKAGEIVKCGGKWSNVTGESVFTPSYAKAPNTIHAKFYNEHLIDLAGTPEFDLVAEVIFKRTNIHFKIQEGKLFYNVSQ